VTSARINQIAREVQAEIDAGKTFVVCTLMGGALEVRVSVFTSHSPRILVRVKAGQFPGARWSDNECICTTTDVTKAVEKELECGARHLASEVVTALRDFGKPWRSFRAR